MSKKKQIFKIIILVLSFLIIAGAVVFVAINPYIFRYYFDNETYDISEKANSGEITLMSFNVRSRANSDTYKKSWYYRANLTLKIIKQEQPDIIGFQEAQIIHEKYYQKHLKGYTFQQGYREGSKDKEGTLILYRNDIFDARNAGLFWLSETPDVQSKDWGSDCFRVANYVTLKNKNNDNIFTIINTHLDHISEEARVKGMGVIISKVEELNLVNPIIMGDMNDTENSSMYQIATNYGLNDAQKVATEKYIGAGATYHAYGKGLNYPRIDFFFVKPLINVNDYHVVDTTFNGVYPSDHFPIVVKCSL